MEDFVVKPMKTRSGLWAVFYGVGKATKLAYQRWFKDEETAKRWSDKFQRKMYGR